MVEATDVVTGVDDALDGVCDEDRPRRRYNWMSTSRSVERSAMMKNVMLLMRIKRGLLRC